MTKWEAAYYEYVSKQSTKYLPWDELSDESRKIWKVMLKGLEDASAELVS